MCPLCKRKIDTILHQITVVEDTGAIQYKRHVLGHGSAAAATGAACMPESPLDRRRGVYARKLRARPTLGARAKLRRTGQGQEMGGCGGRDTPPLPGFGPALWRKLEPWLRRELQVLLSCDDVDLFVLLVKGILERHHQNLHLSDSPGRRLTLAELADVLDHDTLDAFLHELCCFAASPMPTMEAYDRFVLYYKPN